MSITARHLLVRGKVQGVFYRKSTFEKAKELGLTGWVKNMPDGSVEIIAEGTELQLLELINWCTIGPKNAVVTQLIQTEKEIQGLKDFRIIKD